MSRNGILLRIGVLGIAAVLGWHLSFLLVAQPASGPFSILPDMQPAAAQLNARQPDAAANQSEEKPDVAANPEPAVPGPAAETPPAPPAAPPCALPQAQPASTAFWPNPVVAVDAPQPAAEDAELESRLGRFPRSGDLKPEQVEHAHIAGRILFRRALYLQARRLANRFAQPDEKAPFPIPANAHEAETRIQDYLQQATAILTRVRPYPSYKSWSEALYLNAWSLMLLQRADDAVGFLQIVGRTRSQSLYANYARLSLVFYYLRQNNPALAAHWLVQITKVEPRHASLLAFARIRTAVAARRPDLADAALWEELFRLPAGEPITTAFLEQAAAWCVQEKVDAGCIRGHFAKLSPAARQEYLGFAALHAPKDPQNLQVLCQLGGK